MDFATAWTTFDVDDYVAVSNGQVAPSVVGGPAWFMWRSHNFVGKLVEKNESATPRRMQFELAPANGATVGYAIIEGVGHSFAASDLAGFLAG